MLFTINLQFFRCKSGFYHTTLKKVDKLQESTVFSRFDAARPKPLAQLRETDIMETRQVHLRNDAPSVVWKIGAQ